jgi:rubredoxin
MSSTIIEIQRAMTDSAKYQCNVCGYVYDPQKGDPTQNIPVGTSFESLPDDWTCPECGAGKEEFTML